MKRTIMAAAVLVLAAGAALGADITVRVLVTVKDATRAEVLSMIEADPSTFPPLYATEQRVSYKTNAVVVIEGDVTNTVQVVTATTNTVQVVVPETARQNVARLSAGVLENYWRRQLVRFRRDTQPLPVTSSPVTAGETP